MKKKMSIGIRFCGGCNPEIERGKIIREFKSIIYSSKINDRIIFRQEAPDILILTNGCSHACLNEDVSIYSVNVKIISVQGRMIDLKPVPADCLPDILFNEIEIIVS